MSLRFYQAGAYIVDLHLISTGPWGLFKAFHLPNDLGMIEGRTEGARQIEPSIEKSNSACGSGQRTIPDRFRQAPHALEQNKNKSHPHQAGALTISTGGRKAQARSLERG